MPTARSRFLFADAAASEMQILMHFGNYLFVFAAASDDASFDVLEQTRFYMSDISAILSPSFLLP